MLQTPSPPPPVAAPLLSRPVQGQHPPVFARINPSPEIEQSETEVEVKFSVPATKSSRASVFRFEARAFDPLFNTKVRIERVRLCRSPFQWSSQVDEAPEGAYVYGGVGDARLLLTHWLGGTYARARLYEVRSTGIRLLLETSTRDGLQIEPSPSGYPTITATVATPGTQAEGEKVPISRSRWNADRRAYVTEATTR